MSVHVPSFCCIFVIVELLSDNWRKFPLSLWITFTNRFCFCLYIRKLISSHHKTGELLHIICPQIQFEKMSPTRHFLVSCSCLFVNLYALHCCTSLSSLIRMSALVSCLKSNCWLGPASPGLEPGPLAVRTERKTQTIHTDTNVTFLKTSLSH